VFPKLESRADILKMLDELSGVRKGILKRCARLRVSQLNDPVDPGTWSVLKNLAHLALAEEFMLAWIRKRPAILPCEEYPQEPPLDLSAVRIALDEAHAGAIAFVKGNSEAVLGDPCPYDIPGEHTVGGILFHLIEHEIHHRGFILHKLRKLEGGQP
jgi:uncharacterized damage-inducible protein DinB